MSAAYSMWEHEDAIGLKVDGTTHRLDWSTYCPQPDGSIAAWRLIPDEPGRYTTLIEFQARNLQRGRFGDIATVMAMLPIGNRLLSWATLNIGQPRDRFNLASAAHLALTPTHRTRYRREQLLADLDFFCIGLVEAWGELYPEPSREMGYESRSERRALASADQWATIRRLRAQLGIRDGSDLPERLMAHEALSMIQHLEQLVTTSVPVGAGGG